MSQMLRCCAVFLRCCAGPGRPGPRGRDHHPDSGGEGAATAYQAMLSPVEIGVVVICVFIVCMVAICMCAFAAKKTSMKQAEAVPPPPPDYA